MLPAAGRGCITLRRVRDAPGGRRPTPQKVSGFVALGLVAGLTVGGGIVAAAMSGLQPVATPAPPVAALRRPFRSRLPRRSVQPRRHLRSPPLAPPRPLRAPSIGRCQPAPPGRCRPAANALGATKPSSRRRSRRSCAASHRPLPSAIDSRGPSRSGMTTPMSVALGAFYASIDRIAGRGPVASRDERASLPSTRSADARHHGRTDRPGRSFAWPRRERRPGAAAARPRPIGLRARRRPARSRSARHTPRRQRGGPTPRAADDLRPLPVDDARRRGACRAPAPRPSARGRS